MTSRPWIAAEAGEKKRRTRQPNYRLWTTAEIGRVRALAQTLPSYKIGEVVGRTAAAVQRICSQHRIPLQKSGDKHHLSKLSAAQARSLRSMRSHGVQGTTIAQAFGLSPSAVCHIHKNRRHCSPDPAIFTPLKPMQTGPRANRSAPEVSAKSRGRQ